VAFRQVGHLRRPVVHLKVDVEVVVAVPGGLQVLVPKALEVGRQAAGARTAHQQISAELEVKPDESREKLKEWSAMIAYTIRRSPSLDGRLPHVRVYDQKDNLLWDAYAQMERWVEHNSKLKDGFGRGKGSPLGGVVPMPEILKSATYDQLKKLWEESWGVKMPAGIQADVARECLKPRLTASQIQDVLAREYEAAREPEAAAR